ncbi:elongation factor 1-delta isoform X2 [Halictus rubicundus]|uniref:elongation factor 1-delta isoform X2 n=1 Tax=Halictus rubicundus TaxID=77578 RepID=UPI0040366088
MEKSALAQEKIWFDKPSYDKAERLYFESMAKLKPCFKVMPHKIMERCSLKSENSVTNDYDSILNHNLPQSKTKLEKTKDNKLLTSENIPNDTSKNHKTNKSKSNKYENEHNTQKNENIQEKHKSESIRNNVKKKEVISSSDMSTKHNVEEVKEKKNKAETRHRNRGKERNDTTEVKGHLPSHLRKEQQWIQENQQTTSPNFSAGGSLAIEVAKAHQYIKESLQYVDNIAVVTGLINPAENMKDNLDGVIEGLRSAINNLEKRVKVLEDNYNQISKEQSDPPPKESENKKTEEKADDDDDLELFGSDSEAKDAEVARIREERLAAYAAKKSKKPALIAKSNIILDVKPWGSDVDMKQMETEVRKIETDGLLWGAAQLVPLAYGIHKLQISCVVEDEKVSVDWLTEEIQQIEDHVQSVDIAAFNKV